MVTYIAPDQWHNAGRVPLDADDFPVSYGLCVHLPSGPGGPDEWCSAPMSRQLEPDQSALPAEPLVVTSFEFNHGAAGTDQSLVILNIGYTGPQVEHLGAPWPPEYLQPTEVEFCLNTPEPVAGRCFCVAAGRLDYRRSRQVGSSTTVRPRVSLTTMV